MDKKSYIQVFIFLIILIIVTVIYIYYFRVSDLNQVKIEENKNIENVKGSDDLITDMSYFSEDNKGNSYEIKSEYGIMNPNKSNLILMDKVTAVIYLFNGEKIFISSDKANYNDNNNDTTFSGSVKMVYIDHLFIF